MESAARHAETLSSYKRCTSGGIWCFLKASSQTALLSVKLHERSMHPHRPKLSNLVADEILAGIAQDRWTEWLPQERVLAEQLRASRSIVRQALALLKRERIVESFQSKGNRIIKSAPPAIPKTDDVKTIGLLTPGSIDETRPLTALQIDDFRQQLAKENSELQIVQSKSCFKANPETALASLRAHHSSVDCWILRLSNRPMQEWFQRRGIPAVVLGNRHEGVTLPFVAFDRRALSRHAVGVLMRAGHRNFVLLISRESRAGDLENEHGFWDAVAEARKTHDDLNAEIMRHDESVEGVVSQVGKLLARRPRPTAIFVAQSTFYLTVACDLARRGIRIPADISLLTQVGGPFLSFMLPRPACYQVSSQKYARKLLSVVLAVIHGEPVSSRDCEILPGYVPGPSLRHITKG